MIPSIEETHDNQLKWPIRRSCQDDRLLWLARGDVWAYLAICPNNVDWSIYPRPVHDSLTRAFMLTTPWWAEYRQCRTFLCWVLGMTILRSNNIRPLSVLRWCLTSQYSWTMGAVRLCVLGKPCCITH